MRRVRNVWLGLGLGLAILSSAWLSASASAAKPGLTLETAKGPLSAGAPLVMSSSNLILLTSDGNVECTASVLTGTLTGNGAKKDKAAIGETSFTGDESGGRCKTTSPFGPGQLVGSGFVWSQELTTKGTGKLKGSKKVVINYVDPDDNLECPYEAGKVEETFGQFGTTAEALTIEITGQTLKLDRHHTGICTRDAELKGTFSVTSEGETVLARS